MKNKNIAHAIRKNKWDILFLLLLLTFAFIYNYHRILTYRPYSIHQWRQCDCLSIAKNYYNDPDRSFLEPAIYWQGDGKNGKTVSDFPVIYFFIAKLWNLFGFHEYIFRLVTILIVFTGLFCLYKMAKNILNDVFWAMFTTFLLFTSPVLVYYTNNFLADAPALALAITGIFLFWNGISKKNKFSYFGSFAVFLLAGLIKISSLISFCAIFIIHIYLILSNKKERYWYHKWQYLIPYIVVFSGVLLWVRYVLVYNSENLSGIFLTDVYPIWKLDRDKINYIWLCLRKDLLPAYFNKKAFFLIIIVFFSLILLKRKADKKLYYLTLLVFSGSIVFILLFYQAFTVHDYYLTNLLIFIPLTVITMLDLLKKNYSHLFKSNLIKMAALLSLLLLSYETAVITRMKYSTSDRLVKTNFVISKKNTDNWKWYHWDYENHMKAYETLTPYLRKIGIEKNDRVLSLPDNSINITLYLMDQKGFTGFGFNELSVDKKMEIYLKNNVKYMVADSAFINSDTCYVKYIKSKIGTYKNLNIYSFK